MDTLNLELLLKMSIALGAVLIVFALVAFIFKKLNSRFGVGNKILKKKKAAIEVIEVHSLAPGKLLYMIKVAEKTVLVGATQQSINFLTELENDNFDEDSTGFDSLLQGGQPESKKKGLHDSWLKGMSGIPRV